jgi:hypothetical protein
MFLIFQRFHVQPPGGEPKVFLFFIQLFSNVCLLIQSLWLLIVQHFEAVYMTSRQNGENPQGIRAISPRDAYFLEVDLCRALFRHRSEIERVFSSLKNKQGMEQPHRYGKNRYHFHCQLCVLIHNIGFLF